MVVRISSAMAQGHHYPKGGGVEAIGLRALAEELAG